MRTSATLRSSALKSRLKLCFAGKQIIHTHDLDSLLTHVPEDKTPPFAHQLGALTEYIPVAIEFAKKIPALQPSRSPVCMRKLSFRTSLGITGKQENQKMGIFFANSNAIGIV